MLSIAILSTLALDLPMTFNKFKLFCNENNISHDVTGHLGKTLSSRYSQSVHIDEHDAEDKAKQYNGIHGKAEQS